jgi:hypothetical protein
MPLCSGKMKGQAQMLSGNVYMYPQWGPQCMHMMGGMDPAGAPMYFVNNTCVAQSAIYSSCETATDGSGQVLHDNHYFIDNKDYKGGDIVPGFPCTNGSWSAWLATGEDKGSTISGEVPTVAAMVKWGEDLLGF